MAIVITKAAVRRTLEQWFIAARAGQTLGAVETARLSSADAAAQSSDYFFDVLARDEDSFQYAEPAKAAKADDGTPSPATSDDLFSEG